MYINTHFVKHSVHSSWLQNKSSMVQDHGRNESPLQDKQMQPAGSLNGIKRQSILKDLSHTQGGSSLFNESIQSHPVLC